MRIDKRDVFLLLGLISVTTGVCLRFGVAWGAIVAGVVLFSFGLLGGGK